MNILDKITADKRLEVEELKISKPLERFISEIDKTNDKLFKKALSNKDRINIIAEIKKGSPSKGIISDDFDVNSLAEKYKSGNAAALSVLTDKKYFYGSFDNLVHAKGASGLPVLCKDFIIDPYQIYLAKLYNADAILLIVKLLSHDKIEEFLSLSDEIGLDVLVEVHNRSELETALATKAEIIGVNNRNLDDFSVTLETSVALAKNYPDDIIKVSESGILNYDDIKKLRDAGFNNFLIGEALVKSPDPVKLLLELQENE